MQTDRDTGRHQQTAWPAKHFGLAAALAFALASCIPPPPVHEPPPPVSRGPSLAWTALPPSAVLRITVGPVRHGIGPPPPAPPNRDEFYSPDCDSFLPAGATVPPGSDPTLFEYRLAADGTVSGASLLRSSGNDMLDRAALACANRTHRQEAMVAGAPIRWTGGIFWSGAWHGFFDPGPDGMIAARCEISFPQDAIRHRQQGDVIVGFRIATDGTTKDETVIRSSGSALLDEASRRCVHTFRYFPARQIELPVELDKSARIEWRIVGF